MLRLCHVRLNLTWSYDDKETKGCDNWQRSQNHPQLGVHLVLGGATLLLLLLLVLPLLDLQHDEHSLPKWSEGMYFWLVTILFGEGSLCCCCSKWFRPPCSAARSPLAVVGVKWIFMCPPTAPPQSYQICHRTSLRAIRHDMRQRRRSATHGGEAHACTNGDRSDTWRKDKYKIQKYRITRNRFSSDTNDHDLVFLNLTPCYMFTPSLKSQITQLRVWLALEAWITTIRILDRQNLSWTFKEETWFWGS